MKNISICLISKNEEKNIKNCICAIINSIGKTDFSYEICLTDTGSTDNTVETALSLGASVYNYTWQNDFSAARNYAMSKAKYDNILFVDCDEILESFDWYETYKLLDKYPYYVGMITRRNLCNSGDSTSITVDKVARLFNRRSYHYELCIHEQLIANNNSNLVVYDIPLVFYHEGYMGTKEQLQAKAKRNNDLLFKELEKTPNDPYIFFQIAQSYGLLADKEQQYKYYKKAYDLSPDINDIYTTDLIIGLGYSLINNQEITSAVELYNKHYKDLSELADYLCFGAYAHIKSEHYLEAINICQKALHSSKYSVEGSNSVIPNYYLGCIYDGFGNIDNAIYYLELANHYADSDDKLGILASKKNTHEYSYKKLSIILPIISNEIDAIIENIQKQTLGFHNIELLCIGNIANCHSIKELEKAYPDSVLIIDIPNSIPLSELVNIAISYTSGEYITICTSDNYSYIDGLRHIYEASHMESCDIGACNIVLDDNIDFYITIDSKEAALNIKLSNILLPSYDNKIYSKSYVQKNNLDYSKLLNNDAILCSSKIYCCKDKLL